MLRAGNGFSSYDPGGAGISDWQACMALSHVAVSTPGGAGGF
jgi:hypothetical protein